MNAKRTGLYFCIMIFSLTGITKLDAETNATTLIHKAIIARDKAVKDLHDNKNSSKKKDFLARYYDAQHRYLLQKKQNKESQ